MANNGNLSKLQKEAADLGITLDKDADGTYWGAVKQSGMELGGYDNPADALEDLKAVQQLDAKTDTFSYDNDPDNDEVYRVTVLADDMTFTHTLLATAYADALVHVTEKNAPAPAPKRPSRMRKPQGNGPQVIEHEPSVAETLPDAPKVESAPLPYPEKEPPFREPKPKQADITKNLIRSEETGLRSPEMVSPQQQIAVALLQLAKSIEEVANNLGNEALIPLGSAFEEPEGKARPARNRRSSY